MILYLSYDIDFMTLFQQYLLQVDLRVMIFVIFFFNAIIEQRTFF